MACLCFICEPITLEHMPVKQVDEGQLFLYLSLSWAWECSGGGSRHCCFYAFLILFLPCAHPHNLQPRRSVLSSQREPGCQCEVSEVACALGSPLAATAFSLKTSKASTVTLGTTVLWKGRCSSHILWRTFVCFFSAVTVYKVRSLREEKAPPSKLLFRKVAFWYIFSLTLEAAIRNHRSFLYPCLQCFAGIILLWIFAQKAQDQHLWAWIVSPHLWIPGNCFPL